MARRNRPRSIEGESNLARRIQMERERRGWSYETLAKRMTDAGCSIAAASLYKVEKGNPRRKIAVDELLALSTVFEVPVENLLTPVELLQAERAREAVMRLETAERNLANDIAEMVSAWASYFDLAAYEPDLAEYVDHAHRWAEDDSGQPLIRLVVDVGGKEIETRGLDDGPLRDGVVALRNGMVQAAYEAAMAAVEENTRRGIGRSPLAGDED